MRTFCTVVQPICSPGVWENRYFHIRTTRRPHGIIDYPVRLSYATRTEKKNQKNMKIVVARWIWAGPHLLVAT